MARTHCSVSAGLALLSGALALSLLSFFLGDFWAAMLPALRLPADTVRTIHTLWIPLASLGVTAAMVVLGGLGFAFVWHGRWELGAEYASRAGLGLLAFVVAAVAYALYAFTGILLGFVGGLAFLVPWHGLLAAAGAVAGRSRHRRGGGQLHYE